MFSKFNIFHSYFQSVHVFRYQQIYFLRGILGIKNNRNDVTSTMQQDICTMVSFYNTTRMLCEFSFLFRFLLPLENSRIIIGSNYFTKENWQSYLVVVVCMTPSCKCLILSAYCKTWTGLDWTGPKICKTWTGIRKSVKHGLD